MTHRGYLARVLVVVLAISVLVFAPHSSRATGLASVPAAQGQLTIPATVVNDSDAIDGQVVQFNAPVPDSAGFVHPGILLDPSQLAFVHDEIGAGAAPWTGALAAVNPWYATPTYVPRPVSTVDCTANAQGCSLVVNDAIAAYTLALLYSYSAAPDRAKYADAAITVMNAWSAKLTASKGNQSRLALAWSAEVFPRAAEIIRYTFTSGPTDPVFNVAGFTTMLNNVMGPAIVGGDPLSNGNWELSMADGLMNIGVFTDSRTVFNAGVAMWRARVPAYIYESTDNNGNGSPVAPPGGDYNDSATLTCFWLGIGTNKSTCRVPIDFRYYNGMTQETCRDLSHPVTGLDAMVDGAETARLQGVDLYGEQQQRIEDALEFSAAFDNQYLASGMWPATPCGGRPGSYSGQSGDGTGGTGYMYGWETGYNEFVNRLGVAMPNTKAMIARVRPTGGVNASDWETLANVGPTAPAGCAVPDGRLGADTLTITVPADGTYRLWSRVKPTDSADTSYAMQIDASCPISVGGESLPASQWSWTDDKFDDPSSTINLALTAGAHTLTLTGSSPGLEIDSLMLLGDLTCVPVGIGDNCPASNPVPLAVSSASLPGGTASLPYSAQLAATGGAAPYSWSVSAGPLPAGLSLSASGVISGTPTIAGTSSFTVQVTDSSSPPAAAVQDLAITVAAAMPLVTAVSPSSGSPTGGTVTTVTGSGFTGATSVMFGAVPATSFTVVSDSSITAAAPAQLVGVQDISVTTPGGTSAASTADVFTYAVPFPTVTGVAPSSGLPAGGTTVTVTGVGFTGATRVRFGSVAATGFLVVSDTQITATSPAQPAGGHNVTVTTALGTSGSVTADKFTYQLPLPAPPSVTGVAPSSGPPAGGTTVTVTGVGFTGATRVRFGSVVASSFVVVSDTQITAVSPAQAAGRHNITVTTAGGNSATVTAGVFTYQVPLPAPPSVTGVAPSSGPPAGGTTVTVTGVGFTGATRVRFGSVAASSFVVVSDTEITAVSPVQAAGRHNITVTTAGGNSAAVPADLYTYM